MPKYYIHSEGATETTLNRPITHVDGETITGAGTAADPLVAVGDGTGNVVGPASATADAVPLYSGTTGKIIKNSSMTMSGDNVTITGTVAASNLSGTNTGDELPAIGVGDAGKALVVNEAEDGYELALGVNGTSRFQVTAHSAAIAQNLTRYFSINADQTSVTTTDPTDDTGAEEYVWEARWNGQFTGVLGTVNVAPGAGETYTATLMKNAVATDVVLVISEANVSAQDLTVTASFVIGDRFAWRVVTSATSGTFKGSLTLGVEVPAGEASTSVYNEVPTGTINGVNDEFTLAATPVTGSERIYRNGLRQTPGVSGDYQISGLTITFNAGRLPQTGDELAADYNT